MNSNELQETIVKSIRFDIELAEKIQKLANKYERDFSQQVRFMVKMYLNMKEGD